MLSITKTTEKETASAWWSRWRQQLEFAHITAEPLPVCPGGLWLLVSHWAAAGVEAAVAPWGDAQGKCLVSAAAQSMKRS